MNRVQALGPPVRAMPSAGSDRPVVGGLVGSASGQSIVCAPALPVIRRRRTHDGTSAAAALAPRAGHRYFTHSRMLSLLIFENGTCGPFCSCYTKFMLSSNKSVQNYNTSADPQTPNRTGPAHRYAILGNDGRYQSHSCATRLPTETAHPTESAQPPASSLALPSVREALRKLQALLTSSRCAKDRDPTSEAMSYVTTGQGTTSYRAALADDINGVQSLRLDRRARRPRAWHRPASTAP